MSCYEFTLIVEGPDLQEGRHLQALYDLGCSDATVGRIGEVQYLDFDRGAETFAEAVFEAMAAVEVAVPGARVRRLEPDDLVTMAEIAARAGRTRESIRLLVSGERGPGGFPVPATHFRSRQRMWHWPAVALWFAESLAEPQDLGDAGVARFVSAFNAGLELRAHQERLPASDRKRIRQMVS
jgi:hypothetical protein